MNPGKAHAPGKYAVLGALSEGFLDGWMDETETVKREKQRK